MVYKHGRTARYERGVPGALVRWGTRHGGIMSRTVRRCCLGVTPLVALFIWLTLPVAGQSGAKNGEWTTYGGDLANRRYAPLDQINAGNFNKLEIAWRFKTENLGPRPETQFESTPLMARGVVY